MGRNAKGAGKSVFAFPVRRSAQGNIVQNQENKNVARNHLVDCLGTAFGRRPPGLAIQQELGLRTDRRFGSIAGHLADFVGFGALVMPG